MAACDRRGRGPSSGAAKREPQDVEALGDVGTEPGERVDVLVLKDIVAEPLGNVADVRGEVGEGRVPEQCRDGEHDEG